MAVKPVKVSQLNGYIKRVLQSDPLLGNVTVVGEISNLKLHGTGHTYFTLKDENSKLSCFLAADNFKNIRYELADGMEIVAEGYIYLYERGGSYSLNVRDIQVEGVGNLSAAFDKLKEKLLKEGLFSDKNKKAIPFFPENIAVITSETGAAVQDILKIIKSRNNYVNVLVYPVLVQGPGAAQDIARAISEVNRLFPHFDTIITGRGGGSMEELWAFNEEIVARSIFESKIPIISAVGHETDFTIADFVSDKRAETPTAAAQMAVPHTGELLAYIEGLKEKQDNQLMNYIKHKEAHLQRFSMHVLLPIIENKLTEGAYKSTILLKDMGALFFEKISKNKNKIELLKLEIDSLNPKKIMEKGYGAIIDEKGRLISSINFLKEGQSIKTVLSDGEADCLVIKISK